MEFTAKGLGGTYGPEADCWSLGAVLYVMLVARFPEFDHNVGYVGRKVLRLPEALWSHISQEAKSLIQSLMCHETDVRITAAEALRHEWLGDYRVVEEEGDAGRGYGYFSGARNIPPSIGMPGGNRGTHGNDVLDMVLSDRYSHDVRRRAQQSAGGAASYKLHSDVKLPSSYPPQTTSSAHAQAQQPLSQGHGQGYSNEDMPPSSPRASSSSTGSYGHAQRRDGDMGLTISSSSAEHLPLAPLLHLQRYVSSLSCLRVLIVCGYVMGSEQSFPCDRQHGDCLLVYLTRYAICCHVFVIVINTFS